MKRSVLRWLVFWAAVFLIGMLAGTYAHLLYENDWTVPADSFK